MSTKLQPPAVGAYGLVQTIAALAVVSLAFGACRDERVTSVPPSRLSSEAVRDVGVPDAVRPEESLFADLAKTAPSSAGFYFDNSGTLVVLVRDAADDALADAGTAALVASGRLKSRDGRRGQVAHRVQRAAYTFRELSTWRDIVFDQVLGSVEGVISLDLDEARNRVAIGIRPDGFSGIRDAVLDRLGSANVNLAALLFDAVESPVLATAPARLDTQTSDPEAGGILITTIYVSSGSDTTTLHGCTLGFIAQRNGVLVVFSPMRSQWSG